MRQAFQPAVPIIVAITIIVATIKSNPNSYTKQRKDVDVLVDNIEQINK